MLPSPDTVRDWISGEFGENDLVALEVPCQVSSRIIRILSDYVAQLHGVGGVDDRLKLSYYLEDMVAEAVARKEERE